MTGHTYTLRPGLRLLKIILMLIGYARVSTSAQETHLQIDALQRFGVSKIFQEKTSSVGARPELSRCLGLLRSGDVLVVYKLDRVARSLKDLLSILETIQRLGAGFKSITEPVDTSSHIGVFILQILGAVAQLERSIIRERAMAGQRSAQQRGVHCGRPRALAPGDECAVVMLYEQGVYTLDLMAMIFEVHPSVIKRAVYRVHKPHSSSLK